MGDYEDSYGEALTAREAEQDVREAAVIDATVDDHVAMAARLSARTVSSENEVIHHLRIQTQLLWALVKRDG